MLVHGGRDDLELPHLITTVIVSSTETCHQTGLELSYITVGGVVPSEAIIDALAGDIQ
ncbi:hypothetical protein Bca52824_027298 [Brassica carinata]|uniref:Uncharacterized protein n=1 Tax=Brassica carinata TaxID=52824 RepID=A0A8X7SJ76_BRACI|nr:hypothetical protein Bca52824_027298 [Brassica carinata]